jgi:1-deoxy-D-xylulose-5-phosphate synthase
MVTLAKCHFILANLNNPTTIAHYDFAFVKPLDEKELHSIFKTFKTIITLEDE